MKPKVVYCLPRIPYNGSFHNGIMSMSSDIASELRNYFNFEVVYFDFLSLLTIEKIIIGFKSFRLNRFILNPKKFSLTHTDLELLDSARLVHYWHPEFAGIFKGEKSVVTCLGLELFPEELKSNGSAFFENIFDKTNAIHSISRSTEDLLANVNKKKYPTWINKTVTIYPCLEVRRFNNRLKKFRKNNITIGTLSRLVPEKNISTVIEALKILKHEYNLEFKYLLAGSGPEKNYLIDKLEKYGVNFSYIGEISDKDKICAFYHMIDMFVLPSLPSVNREGIGISHFEAAAAGNPLITARDEDQMDDELFPGLYVNYRDPGDVAKKIFYILNNWQYFNNKTFSWIKKFDRKMISKSFKKLYMSVLYD